jgi:hypothetical protein
VAGDEAAFEAALRALAPHKVGPLLRYQLAQAGLLDAIPSAARARLDEVHAEVQRLNRMLFLCAAQALRAAERRDASPCLLKGLLFADSYYPDPATRPMGDMDLVAPPGRSRALHEALEEVGFARVLDHVVQDHAVAFLNAQGVACDAHAYLEMFPDADWARITRPWSLRRLRGVTARALEPHTLFSHLALHMHGHSRELGLVLLWLLDIAFVLRRHGAEIDVLAVRAQIQEPAAWALLLRVLGLLSQHGEPLPAPWGPHVRKVPPLSLGAVLRARRVTPWGLPGPLGWARLCAHGLSLRDYSHRAAPELLDLCLLPFDLLQEQVSPHLVRLR